jgi:hypothetical protein
LHENYFHRFAHSDFLFFGVVDLEKARWYLDRLIDEEISG